MSNSCQNFRRTALAAFAFLAMPAASHAAVGDLYASTGAGGNGCGGTPSSLYKLSTADASATLVAPIMIGSTQARHVVGLAFHPSTGVLYGVMNGQDTVDCTDLDQSTLLTIDPATGAATIVGSQGSMNARIPDIAFDPYGTLYGWNEPGEDELLVIDITNGTASQVAVDTGQGTSALGLASDSLGRLYAKNEEWLTRIDQYTGRDFGGLNIDHQAHNMLAFDASDVMYSGERTSTGFELFTIDPSDGSTSVVGTNSIQRIGAITFDRGVVTPPPVSDLSLTKEIDVPQPLVGDTVVFTLTLANDGPDAVATVVVDDTLPFRFTFVSASGDGSYDENTGRWTVGPIADNDSAVLEITATANESGGYSNHAEVFSSTSYDSDSVPWSGDEEADMHDEVQGQIVLPSIFSMDRYDDRLWVIDPEFQTYDVAQDIELSGHSICGGNGLAVDPTSEDLYGVVQVDDCSTGMLVTIDPVTATATQLGSFEDTQIEAIAFAEDGTLYGGSADSGDVTDTLFEIDPTDGSLTPLCTMDSSLEGRALAYSDGLLYDASYDCDPFCNSRIRVIDTTNFPADPSDPCPVTDTYDMNLYSTPTALTIKEVGAGFVELYLAYGSILYQVTIDDVDPVQVFEVYYAAAASKGLAVLGAPISSGNLSIYKSASKTRVKGDKFITYVLAAANSGPDGLTATISDEVPFGTTFVSAGSGCGLNGNTVSCDSVFLDSNSQSYFEFTVQVTCKKCSSINNTAYIELSGDGYEYPYDNAWGISTSVKGKF